MRKTTDPREHKYLIDREFNTFNRGAIEDCPPELLYGKSALAAGFNVNCHKSYFEGRTGSKVFSRTLFPALDVWARKEGNTIIAFVYDEKPFMSQVEDGHYITWLDGRRELLLHGSLIPGTQAPYEIHFRTETYEPQPVLMQATVTGKPSIWHWHTELKLWVRLEAGVFATASWDIMEWRTVDIIDGEFAAGRSSFVETRTGGFIYNLGGIFRWVADTNEVFKINVDAPFALGSLIVGVSTDNSSRSIYRYLLTGTRIIRSDADRLNGGIVDYETSAFEHKWHILNTGIVATTTPISNEHPVNLGSRIRILGGGIPKSITHISVYRTLDTESIDAGDPNRTQFNSPNRFGLVGDFKLGDNASNRFAEVIDNVDDTLRSRNDSFYPRTRFNKPLPNCNVAAAIPGFVMCAIAGDSKIYYTSDDTLGGYTYGSHNPVQINEQMKDSIQHIELFPDVVSIIGSRSSWKFPTGLADYYEEPGSGHNVPVITKIELADNNIGCIEPYSIQHIPGGQIVLVTREGEHPAVRIFNGHTYSKENYLEDATLGLSRNKRRVRLTRGAIAVYSEATGYIVWRGRFQGLQSEFGDIQMRSNETLGNGDRQGRPNEEEILIQAVLDMGNGNSEQAAFKDGWDTFYDRAQTQTMYCFRVAMRGDQGGGVTEYGGENWVWPDIRSVSVTHGFDPDGDRLSLVEDVRTGIIYRIGLAEQWLDKLNEDGSGFEIPTRIALPTIADGYKWQKHLETHIAMRCWTGAYRGIEGYTDDGFRTTHKCDIRVYEDGELIDHVSELKDLNRNGDYAYIKKIEARRIQEVIETTTSAYRISQIVTKVQTSNREALPGDNLPSEVLYQKEWRESIIHLSRNLPYPLYNRADGTDMSVSSSWIPRVTDGPFGRMGEAVDTGGLHRYGIESLTDFTLSLWVDLKVSGRIFRLDGPVGWEGGLSFVENRRVLRCSQYSSGVIEASAPEGWLHIVMRRSNTSLILFVNGELVEEATVSGTAGGGRVFIGDNQMPLFDVRLIGRAVSDESIRSYYEAIKRGGEGWLP